MGLFGNAPDFTGTVRSLLSIEVNTILAETMSAEPMPALPHALLDIADWYATYLCRLGADVNRFTCPGVELKTQEVSWTDPKHFTATNLTCCPTTFDALRSAAEAALDNRPAREPPLTPPERVMLYRIVKNCEAIKTLFRNSPTVKNTNFYDKCRERFKDKVIDRKSYYIPPDDIVTLQRIWDIGTQVVVAQTVVYLNGNVTTRIQKGFDNEGGGTLFGLHRQSVDVSVSCWHYLMQAIREIAGTALSTLLKPR